MLSRSLLVRGAAVGGLVAALVGGVVYASGALGASPDASFEAISAPLIAATPLPPISSTPATAAPTAPARARKAGGTAKAGGGVRVRWSGTVPTVYPGDHLTLSLSNGATAQQVTVRIALAARGGAPASPPVDQVLRLQPNETREVSADNTAGGAGQFRTLVLAQDAGLTFTATVHDSQGVAATLTQRAFVERGPGQAPPRAPGQKPRRPGAAAPRPSVGATPAAAGAKPATPAAPAAAPTATMGPMP